MVLRRRWFWIMACFCGLPAFLCLLLAPATCLYPSCCTAITFTILTSSIFLFVRHFAAPLNKRRRTTMLLLRFCRRRGTCLCWRAPFFPGAGGCRRKRVCCHHACAPHAFRWMATAFTGRAFSSWNCAITSCIPRRTQHALWLAAPLYRRLPLGYFI